MNSLARNVIYVNDNTLHHQRAGLCNVVVSSIQLTEDQTAVKYEKRHEFVVKKNVIKTVRVMLVITLTAESL